jgi:hypothetical protein
MSFSLGGIFSGQLQAKAYQKLNGVGRLAGWRCFLFSMDVLAYLLLVLVSLCFLDSQQVKSRGGRQEDEHALARSRVKDECIVQSRTNVLSRALLKRVFTKWHFYVAVLCFTLSVKIFYYLQVLLSPIQ